MEQVITGQAYTRIDSFVESTRDVLFLRKEDLLLIIRPNKIQHVNRTAYEMLELLYIRGEAAETAVRKISDKYGMPAGIILRDISEIINSVHAIMKEDYSGVTMASTIPFAPEQILYPILSEIALTYSCQNRCDFCYASSPYRGADVKEMSTAEVKTVIDKIAVEAKVPTLSFTGGEPTLRKDLPELIVHAAGRGLRVNLISNGIRCADTVFVRALAGAGLHSAQISLESHIEEIHDDITGNPGSFQATWKGIRNLKETGIHTHTNTTVCRKNHRMLMDLVEFIHRELQAPYLSMNMIIATGIAKDNENAELGYSKIGEIIEPVIDRCEELGMKFVWYSPTPFCLFNPVEHGLGAKSCACVSGLLSVNPAGEVLPCSSYDRGIGNLLKKPFRQIWTSDQALYFRERRYVPPVCRNCELAEICAGACPLYWENAGGFEELEGVRGRSPKIANCVWNIEKRMRVRTRGTGGIKTG